MHLPYFQYPAKIEPIRALAAPAETVTLDKWDPARQLPPRGTLVHASQQPALFFQLDATQQVETVHSDAWVPVPQQNPRTARVGPVHFPFLAYTEFTVPAAETVTLDKWYVEHQQNPWRGFLHPSRMPFRFTQREAVEEAVHPDAFIPVPQPNPYRLWLGAWAMPSFWHQMEFVEAAHVDAFVPVPQPNPRLAKSTPWFYPYYAMIETVIEVVTIDKWYVEHQQNPTRRLVRPQGWPASMAPPTASAKVLWRAVSPSVTSWRELFCGDP